MSWNVATQEVKDGYPTETATACTAPSGHDGENPSTTATACTAGSGNDGENPAPTPPATAATPTTEVIRATSRLPKPREMGENSMALPFEFSIRFVGHLGGLDVPLQEPR